MKKTIYYWAPFLTYVATIKAVVNSASCLERYSNTYKCKIINSVGEWDFIYTKNVEKIRISSFNLFKFLPKFGFILSRLSFFTIFVFSFFSLKKLINKKKPDFLIVHLITSLPLLLLLIFNFETKFILRISGFPRINFFRRILWKMVSKKIFAVTAPTTDIYNMILKLNIFDTRKISVLYDPVFEVKDVLFKNNENLSPDRFNPQNKFILSIGRFTRQKNFILLVQAFADIIKKYPNYRLIILGEGEEESVIKKIINDNNLDDKVFLEGRVENVYPYFNIADCFLLTSLWEDPGFVLIESALLNTIVISSDCPTGPKEILHEGKYGYLFRSNNKEDLLRVFSEYSNDNSQNVYRKKVNLKKSVNKFSIFKHYISLNKILNR